MTQSITNKHIKLSRTIEKDNYNNCHIIDIIEVYKIFIMLIIIIYKKVVL